MTTSVYWHFPMSINCQKSSLALAETGFPVESRLVNLMAAEHLDPAYMAVNPTGLVPCLQLADGTTLADSADIVLHVATHATDGCALLPVVGSPARAAAEEWFARGRALPIEQLTYARKALPGGDKLIAMRIAAIQRHLADPATPAPLIPHYQRRLDGYVDRTTGFQCRAEADFTDEMREELEARVRGEVDALEALLSEDARAFIAGDTYSIADCLWTALLARISFLGLASWWADGARPGIAAYFERMRARPSYAAAGVMHERMRR